MEHRIYLGSNRALTNTERVIQTFELNVGPTPNNCAFDAELQQFEVRCSPEHANQLTEELVNAIKSVSGEIDADQGGAPSAAHCPRFLATNGLLFHNMEQIYEFVDKIEENRQCADDVLQQPLIWHQNVNRVWRSKLRKDQLEKVFSERVLSLVESATRSRVERKPTCIGIAADSEEVATATIRKLEVLEEAYLLSHNIPSFDFYDDGREVEYNLRFRSPRNVIDYDLACRKDFPTTYNELILVKWDESVKQHKAYSNRSIQLESNKSYASFWADHISFRFGQDDLCLFCHTPSMTEEPLGCRDTPVDTNFPMIEPENHAPTVLAQISSLDRGALVLDYPSSSTTRFVRTRRVPRTHAIPEPPVPTSNSEKGLGHKNDLSQEHIQPVMPLREVQMALVTSNATDIDASIDKARLPSQESNDSSVKLLVHDDSSVLDALQENDETSTRQLRSIPALLAPRMERKTRQEIDHSKNIIPALTEILKVARAQHSSYVKLEVLVGKLYISTETVDEKLRSNKSRALGKLFRPDHWSTVFRTLKCLGKATAIFSPRLGTSRKDAYNLMSLTDNSGAGIFAPSNDCTEGFRSRVDRIEICCRSYSTGEQVLVIVSADRVLVQGKWETLGDVNLHFPKQAWDACFRMKSAKCLNACQTALYEAIIKNLWVRIPNHDELGTFSLDKVPVLSTRTGSKETVIESVELRQELTSKTNSAVVDGLSVGLTQVHRLKVERRAKDEYLAWLVQANDCDNTQWRWLEMKIYSDGVNQMFSMENPTMEVGGFASYDCWATHKESIKRLISLTRLIVPKIDGIGASTEVVDQSLVAGVPKTESSVDLSWGRP